LTLTVERIIDGNWQGPSVGRVLTRRPLLMDLINRTIYLNGDENAAEKGETLDGSTALNTRWSTGNKTALPFPFSFPLVRFTWPLRQVILPICRPTAGCHFQSGPGFEGAVGRSIGRICGRQEELGRRINGGLIIGHPGSLRRRRHF
jgi:hypothetical protein